MVLEAVADPDIWVLLTILFLRLRGRRKVYSQTGWGIMAGFPLWICHWMEAALLGFY